MSALATAEMALPTAEARGRPSALRRASGNWSVRIGASFREHRNVRPQEQSDGRDLKA